VPIQKIYIKRKNKQKTANNDADQSETKKCGLFIVEKELTKQSLPEIRNTRHRLNSRSLIFVCRAFSLIVMVAAFLPESGASDLAALK